MNYTAYGEKEGLSWTEYIGLPQKDKNGFFWIPTDKGLYRFDGINFKKYCHDPHDPNGLPDNHVVWFYCDREGIYWCYIFQTGLYLFNPETRQFFRYRSNNRDVNIQQYQVSQPFEDDKGNLWLGAERFGLAKICRDDNTVKLYTTCKNNFRCGDYRSSTWITRIEAGADKSLWCCSNYGLVHFFPASGRFDVFAPRLADDNPQNESFSCTSSYIDNDSTLWITTWGKGLFHYYPAADHWEQFKTEPEHYGDGTHNIVTSVYPAADGSLWMYTFNRGLCLFDKKTHHIQQVWSHKYNEDGVRSIYGGINQCDDNGIWWGKCRQGFLKINPLENRFRWTEIERGDMLNSGGFGLSCFYRFPGDTVVYAGSYYGEGLYEYNPVSGQTRHYPWKQDVKKILIVNKLFADSRHRFWICTNDGLLLFDTKTKQYRRKILPFLENRNDYVTDITEDTAGNLWIATLNGLICCNTSGSTGIVYNTSGSPAEHLPANEIYCVFKDHADNIWFGMHDKGIGCVLQKNGRVVLYNQSTGYRESNVDCIAETGDGRICYELEKAGLAVLTHPLTQKCTSHIYTTYDGLAGDMIRWIGRDQAGKLWMLCYGGISYCDPVNMAFRSYNPSDGLADKNIAGEGFIDTAGNLYAGFNTGFNTFNIHEAAASGGLPGKVVIHTFRVNGREYATDINYSKDISLPYNENNLSFEFGCMTYTGSQYLSYAYRLEGYNDKWMSTGEQRLISFLGIPPGNYVLRIKVRDRYGAENEQAYHFGIRIKPAFWQMSWFRLFVLICVCGLLYGVIIARFRRIKKQAALNQVRVEAEMKALRAQMNPHFIFNCMNTIDAYIHTNKPEEASAFLHQFSDLIRIVLENSVHELVPLTSDLAALQLYLSLEQKRNRNRFSFQVQLPQEIKDEGCRIPPMLIQPFAENAILHGLRHREPGDGNLNIIFTRVQDELVCMIEDNGVGRVASAKINKEGNRSKRSLGIQVTRERLHMLADATGRRAEVSIEDREAGPGTVVQLTLPFIRQ